MKEAEACGFSTLFFRMERELYLRIKTPLRSFPFLRSNLEKPEQDA